MAKLLQILNPAVSDYVDRRFNGTEEQFREALATSTTLYVGNLSFYTREEQIYDVFSKVGDIKRIIMGLDKHSRTPCGFCFAEYSTRQEAELCVKFINGTKLDDRPIRVDHDWGFQEGRQFGRGRSGGQVRDEYRQDYDPGRGGYGRLVELQIQQQHLLQQSEYAAGLEDDEDDDVGPGPSKRARTDAEPSHRPVADKPDEDD